MLPAVLQGTAGCKRAMLSRTRQYIGFNWALDSTVVHCIAMTIRKWDLLDNNDMFGCLLSSPGG